MQIAAKASKQEEARLLNPVNLFGASLDISGRPGQSQKGRAVFPDCVGGVERMVFSFGAFEKVKLYKSRDFFQMAVARHPDLLEGCFRPLGNAKAVHGNEH